MIGRSRVSGSVISWVALGWAACVSAQTPAEPGSVTFTECTVARAAALCARLDVPEDPTSDGGRALSLRIVVLPALESENRLDDPLLILEGGPGASVVVAAPMHVATFAGVRRRRDLVFVEQRGTGETNPLDCGLGATRLLDPVAVAQCRDRLLEKADLRYYGTSQAVADLSRAIEALGYRQVNVFGISYGTRTALELLRRHPQVVRSVSLVGTYPPQRNAVLEAGVILDRSLRLVVEACRADQACGAAYPDLQTSLEALAQSWEAGAASSPQLSPLEIASTLRLMLFYPLTTRQIPSVITAVSAGDLAPLLVGAQPLAATVGGITDGAFLSLLCSEDVARVEMEEAESLGRGTLLGARWAVALREACAEWTLAEVPADFHDPIEAVTPILSMTGELDPSMPPAWGDELAAGLEGARHFTVPEAQHGFMGMRGVGCIVELLGEFIEVGSAEQLDPSCLEQVRRPPFAVP